MKEMRGITVSKQLLEAAPDALFLIKKSLKVPDGAEEYRYGRFEGTDENGERYSHRTFSAEDGNMLDVEWVWEQELSQEDKEFMNIQRYLDSEHE